MRLLICDDQAVVRKRLEMLLRLQPDIEVIGSAENGAEAVRMAEQLQPDLVLMDLKMPGMNGIEATRQIYSSQPATKVLVLTTYAFDQWVIEALRAGAAGYLLKDAPWEEILRAIQGTVQGLRFIDPEVAGVLIERAVGQEEDAELRATEQLTAREIDVLHCLTRGLTNAEIAAELNLATGTVRNYLSVIFAKLGVTDRTRAVIVALRHGLVG